MSRSANLKVENNPDLLVDHLAQETATSKYHLALLPSDTINAALGSLARLLRENVDFLTEENGKDLSAAREKKLSPALIDRLTLTQDRIEGMAKGVETIIELPDPVGRELWQTERPNGLQIARVAVPIGTLGMIYESRPNVTIDAAALCLKSHNAVILRGGSESLHSSKALHSLIQKALEENGINPACISMIPTKDREAVGAMLSSPHIDVMIPRGGKGLIERVIREARMPVFSHLDGLCHIYIHEDADRDMALDVTLNAKMRRTGICGAMETLLIHKNVADETIIAVLQNLRDRGCEIRGDVDIQKLFADAKPANTEDWQTEYLDSILSVKMVEGLDDAIDHINTYGSHHTDSILTQSQDVAAEFLNRVDSAIVMHNASTQFADGGEFGMGAEIGIATGKLHARGPVGLEQLCTYKYVVKGSGQTRPV